jgi:hypothetical protein
VGSGGSVRSGEEDKPDKEDKEDEGDKKFKIHALRLFDLFVPMLIDN